MQTGLQDWFQYQNGKLIWLKKPNFSRVEIGSEAGKLRPDGYKRVGVLGKNHYVHRLVFEMFHGYCPEYVDHIDGDRANNRIENLRAATKAENGGNRKKGGNTSSRYKGVAWIKAHQKWKAYIYIANKPKHLGYFSDEEEAALAYNKEALQVFGEFAKLNELPQDLSQ